MTPSTHVIGIDVGGTKIAAGLVAFPDGRPLARRVIATGAARGGGPVLQDTLELARLLAGQAEGMGCRVEAIGLGVCELVDHKGALASSHCIHWLDQPVQRQLSTIAPTVIEADVRAAALAEALLGAGRSFRLFLYLTVGTGISCCLMRDGHPHLGARGATGTMASSPLSVPCEQCGHISRRTLEQIASGPGLTARLNALEQSAARGHDVIAAAVRGDPVAVEAVDTAAETLGSQTALMVNVLDPEAVVVGGGLGLSDGPYWEHFVASTRRHLWSEVHRGLPILRAATGTDAGWLGAGARAWREFCTGTQEIELNKSNV